MIQGRETAKRVVTGMLGGAGLLLLILFGGYPGISLVCAVLAAAMCWELANTFFLLTDRREKAFALVGTSWLIVFVNTIFPRSVFECLVVAFVIMFTYFLATSDRHAENLKQHFDEFVFSVFSLVYVVALLAFLPIIRSGAFGELWIILFLLIVWTGDTAAYFVGRKYGKRKLYAMVSPKKTVEGGIAGLIGGLIVATIFKVLAFPELSFLGVFVTAIIVGIFAQIGDFCESLFKRSYGIKDTSNILPGHGGMLDRFDGVIFSLPLMYLCVKLFG